VLDQGYTEPTPAQQQVIPHILAGRDVLACAQTGTGKTAAFVLPILQLLADVGREPGPVRVLILSPTRELAAQIAERVSAYGRYLRFRHALVYGGVGQERQVRALRQHPEVVVATPGRLLDLLQQGLVALGAVTHFVLDEADRMLDMGFIDPVRRIARLLPTTRQTMMFSATIPRAIESLAQSLLKEPVRVAVTPGATTAVSIGQSVVHVARNQKVAWLEQMLRDQRVSRALVFTRTKRGANRVSEQLTRLGIGAAAIHGNKSQGARERALAAFRAGNARVLVATDVAARGIDVADISHVINFDLPDVPESYIHRVGRTGRAGATGQAISLCDRDERPLLADIERLIRLRLEVIIEPEPSASPRSASILPQQASTSSAKSRSSKPHRYGRSDRRYG
ncbi:MAG TPA: DEAD/DEAH box helicase, partial [Polyangiaceae bacterium]